MTEANRVTEIVSQRVLETAALCKERVRASAVVQHRHALDNLVERCGADNAYDWRHVSAAESDDRSTVADFAAGIVERDGNASIAFERLQTSGAAGDAALKLQIH